MYNNVEKIRPSSDLRNHYNEISKSCNDDGENIIITVNGRGDTVVLSYEEYNKMKTKVELLENLLESEENIARGETKPISETFKDLRKILKED